MMWLGIRTVLIILIKRKEEKSLSDDRLVLGIDEFPCVYVAHAYFYIIKRTMRNCNLDVCRT